MRPETKNQPTGPPKSTIGVEVATTIIEDLPTPPDGVSSGSSAMLWAAVPKAAVDKNRDARPAKHDVAASPKPVEQKCVDGVAQTATMQFPAESHLSGCLPLFGNPHPLPNVIR